MIKRLLNDEADGNAAHYFTIGYCHYQSNITHKLYTGETRISIPLREKTKNVIEAQRIL